MTSLFGLQNRVDACISPGKGTGQTEGEQGKAGRAANWGALMPARLSRGSQVELTSGTTVNGVEHVLGVGPT